MRTANLLLLTLLSMIPGNGNAQDAKKIEDWVTKVVETTLNYHCRVKFGDNEKTLKPNPDKLVEKWQAIREVLKSAGSLKTPVDWKGSGVDLNDELIRYFHMIAVYEDWLRQSRDVFRRQFGLVLIRAFAEEVGGDNVRRLYKYMPDRLEFKQDLSGLLTTGMKQALKEGRLQMELEQTRYGLIRFCRSLNEPAATRIADQLTLLGEKTEFEKQWLLKYRPGLILRLNEVARKEILEIEGKVNSRFNKEKLTLIENCRNNICRRFMTHYTLAKIYQEKKMPTLAVDHAKEWTSLLDRAYKLALAQSSNALRGSSASTARLLAAIKATSRVATPPKQNGKPYDYVTPIDLKLVQEEVEIAAGKLGFIGTIDAIERIQRVEIIGDELIAMGLTGLATYDLKTGSNKQVIYDYLGEDR